MRHILDLIGRVTLALIFLFEAADSILYYQDTKVKMTEYGLTWQQDFLLISAIIILIFGGTLVLIGYRSKLGAVLLILYWIPVTCIVHSFWNDPPDIQRMQSILFMKNMAIMGGLLLIYVNGSGRLSVKRLFATTRVPQKRI